MTVFSSARAMPAMLIMLLAGPLAHHAHAQQGGQAVPAALGQPMATAQLAQARGTGGVAIDNTMGASVAANSASQLTTGSNAVQGGAFAGASGLPVVIQNSGANVVIQNATVINLRLQ